MFLSPLWLFCEQNEKQFVQFSGNAYILSPYPIKTQSTTVVLATTNIESFSRVAPTSTSDNEITYGPYSNVEPYSNARVTIHYEYNGPFLTLKSLSRLIEVSHWGNIAIEEHVHVKHTGDVMMMSCTFEHIFTQTFASSLIRRHILYNVYMYLHIQCMHVYTCMYRSCSEGPLLTI